MSRYMREVEMALQRAQLEEERHYRQIEKLQETRKRLLMILRALQQAELEKKPTFEIPRAEDRIPAVSEIPATVPSRGSTEPVPVTLPAPKPIEGRAANTADPNARLDAIEARLDRLMQLLEGRATEPLPPPTQPRR
jgi:hypothetical protein